MQAEFLVDENENVWFSHARKIEYRWCTIKQTHPDLIDKDANSGMDLHQQDDTDLMVLELEEYMRKNNLEQAYDQS